VKKEEGEIDWSLTATEIWRRVRAFYPWPGCYTVWRGKLLKIIEAMPRGGEIDAGAGQVIELKGRDGALGIGTGDSILEVLKLQLASRKVVTAAEFTRGQREFIGSVLPS
jgi:methionyl-tRNA formyltransferase